MTAILNTDKLAKLLALASSDNDGEALAALRAAKGMLDRAGVDFVEIGHRLARPEPQTSEFDFAAAYAAAQRQPPRPPEKYRDEYGNTWASKAECDKFREHERQQFERNRAKYAGERAAILARYGNAETAIARDARERTLHEAVAQWLVPQLNCKPEKRWSVSLDGWGSYDPLSKASERVVMAVKAALPMPATVAEAIAELNAWDARDREISLAIEDYDFNGGLDLPAEMRCTLLRHMIERDLAATTLADVIARLEYAETSCCVTTASDMADTVLSDLRRLLAETALSNLDTPNPTVPPVQSGQSGRAADRRVRILALLSNLDTASWSDRAIARAVGVSPTTVGNLRRQAAGNRAAPNSKKPPTPRRAGGSI